MALSHAIPLLACLCVSVSTERVASQWCCSHSPLLDGKSRRCLSLRRHWNERVADYQLFQLRTQARKRDVTPEPYYLPNQEVEDVKSEVENQAQSLPLVVPSAELGGFEDQLSKPKTRRKSRRSKNHGTESEQLLESDQAVDLATETTQKTLDLATETTQKTGRSRSPKKERSDRKAVDAVQSLSEELDSTSQNSDNTTSPKRRKPKKQFSPVHSEVRNVTNAEENSDEGIQANSEAVSRRVKNSKDAKVDAGGKPLKAATAGEEEYIETTSQVLEVSKSSDSLPKQSNVPAGRRQLNNRATEEKQVNSLHNSAASGDNNESETTHRLHESDTEPGTFSEFLHKTSGSFSEIVIVHNTAAIPESHLREQESEVITSNFSKEETPNVGNKRTRRRRSSRSEQLKQKASEKVDITESLEADSYLGIESPEEKNDREESFSLEGYIAMETSVLEELEQVDKIHGTGLSALEIQDCIEVDPAQDTGRLSTGKPYFKNLKRTEVRKSKVQRDSGRLSTGEPHFENMEQTKVRKSTRQRDSQRRTKEKELAKPVNSGDEPPDFPVTPLWKGQRSGRRGDQHVDGNLVKDRLVLHTVEQAADKLPKHSSEDQTCVVKWIVEAKLDPGQLLFVVGASSYLGAWEPALAIGFSPCQEVGQPKLWQAQTQVPFGTRSEYNYFIQVNDAGVDFLVWRPGPRLHLVIPSSKDINYKDITVKYVLDFSVENKLPTLHWGVWWKDIGFPSQLSRFLGIESSVLDDIVAGKSEERVKVINAEQSSQPTSHLKDFISKSSELEEHPDSKMQEKLLPNELLMESVYADASITSEAQAEEHGYPGQPSHKLRRLIRRRVLPREEPWLLESIILHERNELVKRTEVSLAEKDQDIEDMHSEIDEVPDSPLQTQEKTDVQTEILINSSECTVERIAILEEGKLVELLLEPVNSDIYVGNVYLGVVKKLLPGMTGVFVDIGYPRIALLSITKNRYPYTFPPISGSNAQSNGSITSNVPGSDLFEVEGDAMGKQEHVLEDDLVGDGENEEEDVEEDEEAVEEEAGVVDEAEELVCDEISIDALYGGDVAAVEKPRGRQLLQLNGNSTRPITVNFGQRFTKWRKVEEGMKIIVQVRREPLGKKGPKVCAFPQLASRFWVLGPRGKSIGVSKKIQGPERKRLKELANLLKRPGFELTVRTEAAGQTHEDLEKDLMRLLDTWKDIMERAEAASIAAENGEDGAVPVLLHRAMGQTLSIVRDFFAERVHRMVVDSSRTYQEVTSYLEGVAPHLLNRVELYTGRMPIFDAFNLESEIDKLQSERVQLPTGAYLVIEETEALVSIDVNGGAGMLGKNMKSAAILEANLAAARQIAIELRLRDIGGIIVVDFIDMDDSEHENLVFEEMRKAIQADRSVIHISEISELGLMELTRRRVRPSVTFMISDPCSCCRATGRVEALETTLSKIERAILRLVANQPEKAKVRRKSWQKVLLRVDPVMFDFLTRNQRAAQLSSALKVYIILKVGRELPRAHFEVSELNLGAEKKKSADGQQRTPARKSLHSSFVGRKGLSSRTQPVL